MTKDINTVWRLMQLLATFNPDMQVMIAHNESEHLQDLGWIDRVGAERHEGEWFAVIRIAD